MKNEVEFKDRDTSIEYIRMALNMCQIGVNYQQAELIDTVVKACTQMGGDFTVEDACDLLSDHKVRWDKYFNEEK